MKLSGVACILCVFLVSNAVASITEEGDSVKKSLSEGKRCMATWSVESSKEGQKTEIFAVRELEGKTLTIPSYERGVARLLRYDRHP